MMPQNKSETDFRTENVSNPSWLLVGAIGFEPMTSTV